MTEMHENAAAYALASLDAAELAEYEVHLATCDFCQRAVAEFSKTVAALSVLSQATPPSRLRQNVLGVIQNVPQLPAEDQADERPGTLTTGRRSSTESGPRPTGPRRAVPGSEISDELDTPPVDELELRRQRRRNRILRGLVAAMLIVVVALGGVIYTQVQQQRQAEVAAKPAFEEQLLRAEDARIVVTPTLQGGGRCTFIVSRKLNRALYLGTEMPDPGQGRRYQLWTATGTRSDLDPQLDNPVPNARPWRQFFRGDVAQADFLAVSIERDGSTPDAPTPDQIVALAEVPPG